MIKILKTTLLCILFLLIAILIIFGSNYFRCPIYRFSNSKPFSGDFWYNPYQNIEQKWLKANFHAHAKLWGGLTSGKNPPNEVYQKYEDMDYDVIGISNYQHQIDSKKVGSKYISVYEHGYNTDKVHQLAINANYVEWKEFPFWQNLHHKQYVLDMLKQSGAFVTLAHPEWNNAYRKDDLNKLGNFDAFEVLNAYKNSENLWDSLLSSGKPAWIMADDDSHDINNMNRTGICWTMINSNSSTNENIIAALKSGKMYGVKGRNGQNKNLLKKLNIENGYLTIETEYPAKEIHFIGQGGEIRKTAYNTDKATYKLEKKDTYIRTEIRDDNFIMLTNPVFRYNGTDLPTYASTYNYTSTWIQRSLLTAFLLSILFTTLQLSLQKKTKVIRKRKGYIIPIPYLFKNEPAE